MIRLEIGGQVFALNPAAISALRYRAAYGESIAAALSRCETRREQEAQLVRLCWMMLPPEDRPELERFAQLCRRDGDFYRKGVFARQALLAADPSMPPAEEGCARDFDEYDILAMMAAARVDFPLIYELPIMHLVSIVRRQAALLDPDRVEFRPMTQEERAELYPHRRRKGDKRKG